VKHLSLLIILCVCVPFFMGCERDPKKPAYQFLPEMHESVPFESFEPNDNTKDGKTLQQPVVGTIARGYLPYPYPDDRERAARELKNPLEESERVMKRGKALYENFCLVCHGVAGKGDGPLIPKFPNPPSLTSKRLKKMSDGELYHVITMGSGQMPSHASQIDPKERWKIVYYVKELQGAR
jgi:mono/diheme cytochrome c family protein